MRQSGELSHKLLEIWVVFHGFDVICLWECSRYWLNSDLIIESEVIKQGLLVAQTLVELEMIVHNSF